MQKRFLWLKADNPGSVVMSMVSHILFGLNKTGWRSSVRDFRKSEGK
jgi:hypothetical protein